MSLCLSINQSGANHSEPRRYLTQGVAALYQLQQPLQVIQLGDEVHLAELGSALPDASAQQIGILPALPASALGDASFCREYRVQLAYYAGAMAHGIASEALVAALAQQNILAIFGAGGLEIARITQAITHLRQQLPDQTFGINLLHNPGNPAWEMACVQLCLAQRVTVVEASAYINLSPALVYYRAAGLARAADGSVTRTNRIIAKVSRREVAQHFLHPAPEAVLKKLVAEQLISAEQAELAAQVPMADDITVEGDSGGHTDQGTLSCIFASVVQLRDQMVSEGKLAQRVRIGAAGGIGTPSAVRAAFALGAAYVVTGSINQATVEAGTSASAKKLLARAQIGDVTLAPSADMFELGAKVQVLKLGSFYPVRAQKLYALYKQYDSLEALPASEVTLLEQQIFHQPLAQVWSETEQFFQRRGRAEVIAQAQQQPKKKMALLFQWYLGQSSSWAIRGEPQRAADYQIWCGSALGALNQWLQGSALADVEQRRVAELAQLLMHGAAYLTRVALLELMQISVPAQALSYSLQPPVDGGNQSLPTASTPLSQQQTGADPLSLQACHAFYKKCWDLLPGSVHENFNQPEHTLVVPFRYGRQSRLWDLDGNQHLDLNAKSGALFVGHHNQAYQAVLRHCLNQQPVVESCELGLEVSELLVKHIPSAEMVRFCLSGSEAIQNVLRLARAFTGKTRFIRFVGHYHGSSDNIAGGRLPTDGLSLLPELVPEDRLYTLGRAPNVMAEQSLLLPWNDIDRLTATIERHHGEIAAVLMEPIAINAGGILPLQGYLQKTKALCEQYNILLIFDEVLTGVRVGTGGAQQLLGVTPHLSIFGKALGGGAVPVSAIVGQRDIMELYSRNKVLHAGTFNGYPLGLAAIKATYSLIEQDPLCYQRMADITRQLAHLFISAAQEVELPLVIQGMPTALVYHAQSSVLTAAESDSAAQQQVQRCNNLIRETAKRYGIQFAPQSHIYANMLMSQDDVQWFEQRIYHVMSNVREIIDATFNKEGCV
ncbi:PfaD family polyunsaturated fatty acid/polyketide biosynthesis protein [Serratia microhaemolytica]|uniref:PfaD family polyunsaturated fatty acid/polyketide biosynthesis protein n=1 Tax=Serratia microhaemolytica TaxID=2675110 RepID=UPI000FDD4779|nr:PfaD family polyunsaturated fatty acid/polyketide biosynthesis protein [Serratia microhaemolytica]